MNKDNFEGGVRSTVGQGERFVGAATDDKASEVRGAYDEVAGSAQSAWGSAKDAAKDMADSGSMPGLSRLRGPRDWRFAADDVRRAASRPMDRTLSNQEE